VWHASRMMLRHVRRATLASSSMVTLANPISALATEAQVPQAPHALRTVLRSVCPATLASSSTAAHARRSSALAAEAQGQ
jgi:hypothetical protein